jgi:cellobiose phosphorylase
MDQIGMGGIGESVTVTAQNVLNLKNLADMIDWLIKEKVLGQEYVAVKEKYLAYRQKFLTAMRESAYNKLGYFNGYYNDNKKWLMSEQDPDGENRLYLVSNAWAVISGSATKEMTKSVIDNIKKENFGVVGYNTVSKGFPVYIDKAGRIGNGNFASASPYNHAQSFYVRACCVAGDAEEAYKATRYIFPIEEEYAPVEKTLSSPYAIVNCYGLNHTAGFQFLSGTVSYVLRNFYNNFLGIVYRYDGLEICPCLPKALGDCQVEFEYLGKKFTVKYYQNKPNGIMLNGKKWDKTVVRFEGEKTAYYFADADLIDNNIIEVFV